MRQYECVIFDLDGTLADTKAGIVGGFLYAAKKTGFAYLPQYENAIIGPSLINSFRHLYGLAEDRAQEAVKNYRSYYAQKGMFDYSLYEGIEDLLKQLKAAGCTLAVATTKYQKYAFLILEDCKLLSYFDCIAGSNEDGSRAGKTELLADVMNQTGYTARQCVMIGDKHHDGQGAAYHKMDFVWAKYGYGNDEEMKDILIAFTAGSVEELHKYLRTSC